MFLENRNRTNLVAIERYAVYACCSLVWVFNARTNISMSFAWACIEKSSIGKLKMSKNEVIKLRNATHQLGI